MGAVKRMIEAAGETLYPGNTEAAWSMQDAFMTSLVDGSLDLDPADLQNIVNGDEETAQRVKDQMNIIMARTKGNQ